MFCKFQINSVLESMSVDEVYELCTSILANGQTIVHMLAQRQKLPALRAILKRGVGWMFTIKRLLFLYLILYLFQ